MSDPALPHVQTAGARAVAVALRAKGRAKFFPAKIQRNPLKRRVSDERIQGNPSFSNPQKLGFSRPNGHAPRKPKPTGRWDGEGR
jgi:hypothetical protein